MEEKYLQKWVILQKINQFIHFHHNNSRGSIRFNRIHVGDLRQIFILKNKNKKLKKQGIRCSIIRINM